MGPKVKLVNLDDHCALDDLYDEGGVFIQSGDILIISGRENHTASQIWTPSSDFDTWVLNLNGDANDIDVIDQYSVFESMIIFTMLGTGATIANIHFTWENKNSELKALEFMSIKN